MRLRLNYAENNRINFRDTHFAVLIRQILNEIFFFVDCIVRWLLFLIFSILIKNAINASSKRFSFKRMAFTNHKYGFQFSILVCLKHFKLQFIFIHKFLYEVIKKIGWAVRFFFYCFFIFNMIIFLFNFNLSSQTFICFFEWIFIFLCFPIIRLLFARTFHIRLFIWPLWVS